MCCLCKECSKILVYYILTCMKNWINNVKTRNVWRIFWDYVENVEIKNCVNHYWNRKCTKNVETKNVWKILWNCMNQYWDWKYAKDGSKNFNVNASTTHSRSNRDQRLVWACTSEEKTMEKKNSVVIVLVMRLCKPSLKQPISMKTVSPIFKIPCIV